MKRFRIKKRQNRHYEIWKGKRYIGYSRSRRLAEKRIRKLKK